MVTKSRNHELALVLKNDHRRLKVRTVESRKKFNRARSKVNLRKEESR